MEPFSIVCMTCHARLRVTHSDAVGQVLPCPRCQSMVHVIAPDGDGLAQESARRGDDAVPPSLDEPLVPPGAHRRVTMVVVASVFACATVAAILVGWSPRRAPTTQLPVAAPTADDRQKQPGPNESPSADEANAAPPAKSPGPDDPPVVNRPDRASVAEKKGTAAAQHGRNIAEAGAGRTDAESDVAPASAQKASGSELDTSADEDGTIEVDAKNDKVPAVADGHHAGPPTKPPRPLPEVDQHRDQTPAIRKVDTSSEPIREASLKTRLGLRLNSISVHESPLAEYLAFLSELSAVPITLDIDALAGTNLTPMDPVSLSAQDVMIADALRRVIAPLDLVATIEDDRHLVITTDDAPKFVERVYEVDDLQHDGATPDGVATTQPLAACLRAVIAPHSWKTSDGEGDIVEAPGRLTITQSPAVHSQIDAFLTDLRRARGLSVKQRDIASAAGSAAFAGNQTVSITYVEPVRLVQLWRQLEIAADIQLVVDWRRLESVGLRPDTQITCSVTDEPVDVALSKLLHPLGAAWRPLGDAVVHVSTCTATFAYGPLLVPVAEHIDAGWTPADLVDMLRRTANKHSRHGSAAWRAIRYDVPSRHIVLAGAADARRDIERILKQVPRPTKHHN